MDANKIETAEAGTVQTETRKGNVIKRTANKGSKPATRKATGTIADVMAKVVANPIPITPRRSKVIEKIDLAKVDVRKFKTDYPSSNAGLIALLLSRPCTRHELLGFLLTVYYDGKMENLKTASSRLNGFLANKSPRKSVTTACNNGVYSCK